MIGINELKLMNYTTIVFLKDLKQNTKRNDIISKILKDEACFFKISKQDAYEILEQIGISKEKIGKVYQDLISEQFFYKLKNAGKIKEEDCVIFSKNVDDIFENTQHKNEDTVDSIPKQNQLIEYKESKLKKLIDKILKFFK